MMRSCLHIIVLILLNFTAACGARVHVIHKSTGEKAHLTLKEHRDITSVRWRKDHTLITNVENQKPVTRHPGKYCVNDSDWSLSIDNLMVNDSGYYKAESGQWEEEIIRYHLIVQEAVSEPVIVINLDQHSNTSSKCHITVKCSADGESATYDCDQRHCTRTNFTNEQTSTRVKFSVNYIDNELLECTASNLASTKSTLITLSNKCLQKQEAFTSTGSYIWVVIIISCTAPLVLVSLIICAVKLLSNGRKKKNNERTYQEDKGINTVYSVVRKTPRTEASAESSDAQNAVTTVYDVPSNCARAPQSDSDVSGQKDDTQTIYWKLGQIQDA